MQKHIYIKAVLFIALFMQCVLLFAQKEANIWYFGNKAGLNFNTNPPTVLTNSVMTTVGGCSSVSDRNGDLLFYSNGITVWNKNHQIMTNGTGLFGCNASDHSALVIKFPEVDSMYIIFTTDCEYVQSNGACYSIIDMRLSGKLGAVTTKNVKLVNVAAEKIAATNHANQRDIWITIPIYNTDSIYSFLVTPLGVNLNAIKSITGSSLIGTTIGQIKFSANSTQLALTSSSNSNVCISDFNNLTGAISNSRNISGFNYVYGLEFSSNLQFLYVSERSTGNLFQCPIPNSSTNKTSICKTIDSTLSNFGSLQLGPDSNIYSTIWGSEYLGVINNPNNYYTNCGYVRNAIYLEGKYANLGLPIYLIPSGNIFANPVCFGDSSIVNVNLDSTKIDSINWYIGDTITPIIHGSKIKQFKYLSTDTITKVILAKVYLYSIVNKYYGSLITHAYPSLQLTSDTSICAGDSIKLKATYAGAKYLWQDNTTDSIYWVKTSGLYKVISTLNGCSIKDSTRITVNNYPSLNLGKDTLICGEPLYKLKATYDGSNYLWQDSTTDSTYLVTRKGLYWVKANNQGCIKYDSVKITMRPKPLVNLGNDSLICGDTTFNLKATYSLATNYLWSDNSTDSVLTINKRGKYWVLVNDSGCITKDTVSIVLKANPAINLGNDTLLCQFETLKLEAKYPKAIYKWSDNSTDSNLLVNKAGKYWLMVNDSSCISQDTIDIIYKDLPIVNIGSDTIICGANNYQIMANYPYAKSYLWSDNSTDSVLNINKNGDYWVILNDSGCVNKDTVSIVLKAFPTLNLGNDTMLCQNETLLLKANYSNANYLWSDNSVDSFFQVNKAGKYWLSVTDSSCVTADTIEVRYNNLPIVNLGNDTTLCNNATLLLTAPPNYQSYLWNDLSKENTLLVNKEGMYLVIVNDSGCVAQDEINIYYLNTPNVTLGNDTTVCDAFPFYLKASSQKANYLWSNFSTDSIINIMQSGTYWVKVYNVCGTATDTAKIDMIACNCYLYLPNAFSPNNNTLNDFFLPISNCEMTHYHLQIFNRWGVQLFESTNPSVGWDGKLNGVLQTNDVYTYQVEADLVNSNKSAAIKHVSLKGNVTLLY